VAASDGLVKWLNAMAQCPLSTEVNDAVSLFEPLEPRTTPTAVYEKIRRAILDGRLAQGSQLREAHLAREFGISRAPLREALGRLEEEGLVDKVPFRGSSVAEVGPKVVADIAEVRSLVEPRVVSHAKAKAKGAGLPLLEERLTSLRAAASSGDRTSLIDAHTDFHRQFYELSDNALLLSMWLSWEPKLRIFFIADHGSFSDPKDIARAHDLLADIIKTGSPAAIQRALRDHIHAAPGEVVPLT
jgi:DNA-binding GntR family transcriptional regulator